MKSKIFTRKPLGNLDFQGLIEVIITAGNLKIYLQHGIKKFRCRSFERAEARLVVENVQGMGTSKCATSVFIIAFLDRFHIVNLDSVKEMRLS